MLEDQLNHCHCNIPPQTKRGFERRHALLLTAMDLFLEKGYDEVSLDDVVNHAGGSKASIYKYFGNKKGLFKAICDYRREIFFDDLFKNNDDYERLKLDTFLLETLKNFYQHISESENQKFIRLLFEQSKYNPDLSKYLYEKCPEKILDHVAAKLRVAHQNNLIFCEDPTAVAQMYWGILWHMQWQILMGLRLPENTTQMQSYIHYSVSLILKGLQYR